jgi:hypothetical protein
MHQANQDMRQRRRKTTRKIVDVKIPVNFPVQLWQLCEERAKAWGGVHPGSLAVAGLHHLLETLSQEEFCCVYHDARTRYGGIMVPVISREERQRIKTKKDLGLSPRQIPVLPLSELVPLYEAMLAHMDRLENPEFPPVFPPEPEPSHRQVDLLAVAEREFQKQQDLRTYTPAAEEVRS